MSGVEIVIGGIAVVCLALAAYAWLLCKASARPTPVVRFDDVGPDGLWTDENYGGTDD